MSTLAADAYKRFWILAANKDTPDGDRNLRVPMACEAGLGRQGFDVGAIQYDRGVRRQFGEGVEAAVKSNAMRHADESWADAQ